MKSQCNEPFNINYMLLCYISIDVKMSILFVNVICKLFFGSNPTPPPLSPSHTQSHTHAHTHTNIFKYLLIF